MNLSKRIPLLIGALVFFVSVSTGVTALLIASGVVEDTARESLKTEARLGADLVQTNIRAQLGILQELALQGPVRSMDWDVQREALISEIDRTGYLDFAVVRRDGSARYMRDDSVSNLADRDYIRLALEGKQAISDVIISRVINKPVVMYAVPIRAAGGEVLGALIARRDGTGLWNLIENIGLGNSGYSYLINGEGTIIAHRTADLVLNQFSPIRDSAGDPSLRSLAGALGTALREKAGVAKYFYQGKNLFVGFSALAESGWTFVVTIESRELMAGINGLRNLLVIFVVIFLIIGIVVAFFIGSSVSRPLQRMLPVLDDISGGDLTRRLEVKSKDELGAMSNRFNTSIEGLSGMVSTTKAASVRLEEIAGQLVATMENTSGAIGRILQRISGIKEKSAVQSDSIGGVNRSAGNIKDQTEKLNASIESQAAAVSESSAAVEEMVANIKSVADILKKNSGSMEELLQASESGMEGIQGVNEIMKTLETDSDGLIEASAMIQNIAQQTNLLSMNAAIEAAHAGEVGKGFAVVADEIRKLAENSSTQGKAISSVLNKLKSQINSATALSNESRERFTRILELVDQVRNQEAVIQGAMDEQTTGSSQILLAIRDINAITIHVKADSAEMLEASAAILGEMDQLTGIAGEMSGGIEEIAASTGQINEAVTDLNATTGETRSNVSRLTQDVSKFRV